MADLLFRDVDRDQFVDDIVNRVTVAISSKLLKPQELRLVTREEMAQLLAVSVQMLDGLVADGVVPSVRLGTRRVFRPKDVIDAVVTTNTVGGAK